MLRTSFTLLLATFLSLIAATAEDGIGYPGERGETIDRIVTPPDSPLHFSRITSDGIGGKAALFGGRILITGTYYYGDGQFNDGPTFEGEAAIVPDAETLAKLPYFAKRGKRRTLHVENGAAFAHAMIPQKILAGVSRKHGGIAAGPVAILADHFMAEIVCDGPSYGVRFLSISRPHAPRVVVSEPHTGC